MGFLDSFYANFFTVGSLIPTTFHLFLAYIFLSVKKKSRPTFHLGVAFLYLALFNLGYFVAGGFYHPAAAFHRWMTVGFVLLHESHICMFMLNLHGEIKSRNAAIFLGVQYAVSFIVAAVFFLSTVHAEKVFVMSAHHWDFNADAISGVIGVLIIAYLGVFIAITIWKVYAIKSTERYFVLLMGISYLIASIIPSFANIMSRSGVIDRGTFQVLWDLFSLAGLYILVILYLNFTRDRVPLMSKIVSIIIVTILMILQGFSYYSYQDNERAYDIIHQSYADLESVTSDVRRGARYVIAYRADDASIETMRGDPGAAAAAGFSVFAGEYRNALVYTAIEGLEDDGFRDALGALLENCHPGFGGYRAAVLARLKTVRGDGKKLKGDVLEYLAGLQKPVAFHAGKVRSLPDARFRDSLNAYLGGTGHAFAPFVPAIRAYLAAEQAEGPVLKTGVLSLLDAVGAPGSRHYRGWGNDHYISFLHADVKSNTVYEVGFPYASYRAYLHPSALKFINALFVILFVIFFGFNLFFRGVLIIPLRRLVDGFRDIGKGRLDVQILVNRGDELSFASTNFNQMAEIIRRAKASLDEYTGTLELKVEERTRDLSHSEERYRNILSNIQDGYYEVDLKGIISFVNDSMCRIMGYDRDELLGQSYRLYTDERHSAMIFDIFNGVYASGTPSGTFDYLIRQKDGSGRVTEAVASLITDHDGLKVGFRGILRDITERRRAEEELRRSEEKFRSILESIKEGYYEVDTAGTFMYFNHALCAIYDRTADEIAGHSFREFMTEQASRNVYTSFNSAYRQETGWDRLVYYDILRKDGSRRELEVSIDIHLDKAGAVEGFRGMCRDITERKKAEEALRQSEEKYRSILNAGKIGYYEVDLQGRFTYGNSSFLEYTGYSEDEFIGRDFRSNVIEEDVPGVLAEFGLVYEGKAAVGSIIIRAIWNRDGLTSGDNYISVRRDAAGQVVGFSCVVIDVTERRRAEEALRESEEKYRTFVESATDGIFRNDIAGNFLYVNFSGQGMLGYNGDELAGINYRDLVVEEQRAGVLEHFRLQFSEKQEETYIEFPIVRKDGQVLWLGQKTKLVNTGGDVYEFHGISRDVTERRKAEAANRELEEQKTRFFANISHEIRTPLTLMISPIESVMQGDYGNRINRAFFETLYRNGLRLLKLVNNLLDFSKIEAGRMNMRIREIDLIVFVRTYISAVHSAAESKGLSIAFTAGLEPVLAWIDPEKFDKVIMNLFSNALKFTENGGTISVNVRKDDTQCFVEFRDTGEGIPPQSIASIFDRFSQADTSATRRHEGTGIGLALAKELVEMHGGTIRVESRYIVESPDDHGTLFTVAIPVGRGHLESKGNVVFVTGDEVGDSVSDHRFHGMREMHDLRPGGKEQSISRQDTVKPADDVRDAPPAGEGEEEPQLHGVVSTVLIVDDNPDMRDFLSHLLKKQYVVHWAENGQAGLDAVNRIRPDLIITDVMMPVMDGHQMTGRLKSDPEYRHIPIIMLTAKAEMVNKLEGLELGADDFLTKPFNSRELLARIKTLLKTREYEKEISRRNQEIAQEMEVARLLQRRLLPERITELPGYDAHAVYIPMDRVGGDFYDCLLHDGIMDLFIADVSGHGLPGAFLAMMTKMSLESATDRGQTSTILAQVNDVIIRSTVNSNYVTAFLCMIDTRTNRLRYSNAGHLPPLVYRREQDGFLELKARGLPLGWFRDAGIVQEEMQLLPGDRLILFTDGITECTNPAKEMWGDDRFREFIAAHRDLPATAFCDVLLADLREYARSETFDDDLTIVVFDVR